MINGNIPLEIEAKQAIDMLKTAMTQQVNYSNMHEQQVAFYAL